MAKVELGRLEQIDVRTVWEHEERDFTQWLAAEENLVLLGDALGLELEVTGTEQGVGLFRADILCKDTVGNSWVVIENQLEPTDHTHLGQLLTYAAGLGATTIVWLARQFRDEHRATLDWLNEHTDEALNFFGIEVELWRIGDSAPAPRFNVVSRPNDWVKTKGGTAGSAGVQPRNKNQRIWLEYWTQFMALVRERSTVLKPRKPQPVSWAPLAIGTGGFAVGGFAPAGKARIEAYVLIGGKNAQRAYETLLANRTEIEEQLGEPLKWAPPQTRKGGFAYFVLEDADWTVADQWPQQHEWLLRKMESLHRVFAPRVKTLAQDEPDEADFASEGPAD